MKKKITTLFTAGLTLLGCLSGTAHVFAASEAAELYTRMQQNNGFYTPIIPAEDIYVDYYDFDMYGGIVVRCKDNAEVLPTVAEFMQQRLSSRVVEEPVPFRSDLPAESIHLILYSGLTEEKIAEILSDDRYEVLGTLRTHYQKKAYLDGNWDHSLMIVPTEGCTLDAAMLNTDEYGHITNTYGFWTTEASTEEVIPICEKLTALDSIEYAWPIGGYDNNLSADEIKYFAIDAYPDSTSGDVNGDGKVTVEDAQDVLQEAVRCLAGNGTYSKQAAAAADINGSETVDIADAQLILSYYIHDLGKNPVTWKKLLSEAQGTA